MKILAEACQEAGEYSRKLVLEEDQRLIEQFKKEGVNVIYPDKEPFKEASKPAYDKIPQWTPNLYNDVQKILKTL